MTTVDGNMPSLFRRFFGSLLCALAVMMTENARSQIGPFNNRAGPVEIEVRSGENVLRRTRLGIAERVELRLPRDSGIHGDWWVRGGADCGTVVPKFGDRVTYIAPMRAAPRCIVSASRSDYPQVEFEIVEPNGVKFELAPGTKTFHRENSPSAGFWAYAYLQPADVPFLGIVVREGRAPAEGSGYYEPEDKQVHLASGWVDTERYDPKKGTLVFITDAVKSFADHGPPYRVGSFKWPIPWEFCQLPCDSRVAAQTPKKFATLVHSAIIDDEGTVTVSKGGVTVSAALGDPAYDLTEPPGTSP